MAADHDALTSVPPLQEGDDLEDLFENAPCGYASALPNGRLFRVNQTFATWLGYTSEDLVGRRFLDLLTVPGKIYYETHFAPLLRLQGTFDEVAFDLVRADGMKLPVIANAVVRRDDTGSMRFIRITVFNASERRRYERELLDARRAADQARSALQDLNRTLEERVAERARALDRAWRLSHDLLVVADAEGTLTAVNAAWTNLLGWSASDLLGHSFVEFTHPEDLAPTQAALAKIMTAPLVEPYEYRLLHADGSYRRFAWTGAFEEGQIYATGRHTTVEHEQAAALVRAEEALRQSQKLEAVGQLTGGVAHDFNNLLTIIRSSTDLLRRPNLAEERRKRYVDAISDTVDRASKLTGQLLAFARRQALRPEVFDVGERLRIVSDMLATIVGSRIQITRNVPHDPCFVEADVSQFEVALVNLAVNARDAMNGEGLLELHVRRAAYLPIPQTPSDKDAFVAVTMIDHGAGIPDDKIARIFEPFFTTKAVGKGTGLGLSQVFGFVNQSGGHVTVESEVGRGTTFTLYLRRVEPTRGVATQKPQALDGDEGAGEGRRVLVVEDNVDVGTFSTQLLQDLGYETTWAAGAEEALTILLERSPEFDVVFSDVVMPGMNGVDLGREIRRLYPGLPVILTSGYSEVLADDARHGFELLQKPYAVENLARILRKLAGGLTKRG